MDSIFELSTLDSGIGMTAPELEAVRNLQGYELVRKEKISGILSWDYVFSKWSPIMNKFIYLHHIWDYYKEKITESLIMFEGSQDALNNEALNERFMDCYVRGIYNNVGRPEDVWEVGGKYYDDSDEQLLYALKNEPDGKIVYYKTPEYYKLESEDYLKYDVNASDYSSGLEIVNARSYNIDMLPESEKENILAQELKLYNQLMHASPKYKGTIDYMNDMISSNKTEDDSY